MIGLALLALELAVPPPTSAIPELLLGVPVEARLEPGERARYRLPGEIPSAKVLRVTAEQQGVDLALIRLGPDGGEIALVDSPTGRRGFERLLLEEPRLPGERIEVRSLEPQAPAGRYRLLVTEVPADSGNRLGAERLVFEADRVYAHERAEDRPRALTALREARRLWLELGEMAEAARAASSVGYFERTSGSFREALGSYRQSLDLWRGLGQREEAARVLNDLGFTHAQLGERAEALAAYEAAAASWRELGDDGGLGRTLNNHGLLLHNGGDPRAARALYEQAAPRLAAAGYPALAATVRNNLAAALEATGEPEAALAAYEEVITTQRRLGNPRDEARAEGNRAFLYRSLGRLQDALDGHRRALELQRPLAEPGDVARTLSNLGELYLVLGEPERALPLVEESLALRQAAGDRRGEGYSRHNLGAIRRARGELAAARASFEAAVDRFRAVADRRGLANSLRTLGETLAAQGEREAARARFAEALEVQVALDDRRGRGETLRREAELDLGLGALEKAAAGFAAALALARETRTSLAEIEALVGLARAERSLGRPAEAEAHAGEAIATVDRLRAELATPELRAPFTAPRAHATELAVDLAWDAHRRNPLTGDDRKAFELAHNTRARSLAEAIAESATRAAAAPALLARRRAAAERLSLKALRLGDRRPSSGDDRETATLAREAEQIRQEIEALDAEVARAQPRLAAWSPPQATTVAEVQELLDSGTLLVLYALGVERSFLFALSKTGFAAHELAPRGKLEQAASALHDRWRGLDAGAPRGTDQKAAKALAHELLAPVAAELDAAERLIVIPEGSLGLVPFSALPHPTARLPLVERLEVSVVPSANVLAAIRARRAGQSATTGREVLVIADPVFNRRDPRAPEVPADSGNTGVPADSGSAWGRLAWSGSEAAAVARAWAGAPIQTALGLEATADLLTAAPLDRFRVIHLATHGLVDTTESDRSGLAFAGIDAAGRARPGFVGLAEIHGLQLAAELVVLSGCRTARGRELRFEGPIGLAHGFLFAGAERVVASLWPVEDRATAELMARFHGALAGGTRTPAAALAHAQRELRRLPRWSHPYYWSGFVLYGDGR